MLKENWNQLGVSSQLEMASFIRSHMPVTREKMISLSWRLVGALQNLARARFIVIVKKKKRMYEDFRSYKIKRSTVTVTTEDCRVCC